MSCDPNCEKRCVPFAGLCGFVAKVYVGEFFKYHPVVGFVNHPPIQAPCCNYVPHGSGYLR